MPSPRREDGLLLGLFLGCLVAVYAAFRAFSALAGPESDFSQRPWVVSLLFNMLGYATVFVPGYAVIRYVRESNFLAAAGTSPPKCLEPLVRLFVVGAEETLDDAIATESKEKAEAKEKKSEVRIALTLGACFVGLQASYLTWGVLQEKIMTRTYRDSAGNEGQFKDSQFLVFVNRILAFAIALLYITVSKQPRHRAPMYKYSYCSFSNIMSSWCQYEALKFVSFPTQVQHKYSIFVIIRSIRLCNCLLFFVCPNKCCATC